MTISKGLPLVDGCWLIDNSSYERITTCQRSAEYYILNKRELNTDRIALRFGQAVHKILEQRERLRLQGLQSSERVEALITYAEKLFAEFEVSEDDYRNFNTAVNLIREYETTYSQEDYQLLIKDGKPLLECPFAIPLGEIKLHGPIPVRLPNGSVETQSLDHIKVIWTGRIDAIVESRGQIFVLDHKTTSMMGPTYLKTFSLASQMFGYVWAVQTLLDQPIQGLWLNVLGVRKPTKTGKAFEFLRNRYTYSPQAILEWRLDVIHILRNFLESLQLKYFPKNTHHCVNKYGVCEFWDVCTLPYKERSTLLFTNAYKEVTWSPLTIES